MSAIRVIISERAGADSRNEDHLDSLPEEKILILADGFGGTTGEGGAAARACVAVRQFLVHEAGDREATLPFVMRSYFSLAGNVLFNAIIHANRILLGANAGKSVHARTGASVAAAFLDGEVLSIASVGGCAAWFCRDGRWAPLLSPRTLGRLNDPSIPASTWEARLPMTALGIHEDLEPEVVEARVRPGDRLWLGSFDPTLEQLEAWGRGQGAHDSVYKTGTYTSEQTWVTWEF